MRKISSFLIFCVAIIVASCNSANHSAKSTTNTGVDLSGIDPGRYDTTWWNRAPYRLVQTNLREIDATMDVDAYVQSMVDASANIVLINVGGIVGNYPTKLPYHYRNPFMKGDLVGDLIRGLHSKGIKVIGRFDFSKINETLAAKKPEWLYVSTAGKNVNYNGQVHTCPNGGYQQEYGMEILKEAITTYPLDGIFFNMIGYTTSDYSGNYYGICQCENCKKKFHDSTGHTLPVKADMNDPVFREYNAFKKTTADKLFKQIGNHIKTLNPKIMINTYADAGVDMIASESGAELTPEYEWNYSATDNVKRVLGSYKDRSPGNLLIYFQAIGYRHVGTSPNMAKVWMLENMLHGAPLGFVVVGTLVNYEDRIFIPTLNNLYGFHKTNEKLFTNVQAVNKIALIRGSRDEYEGMIKLLTEEHIMYDIIDPAVIGTSRMPRQLEEYEALILGDVSDMDDRLVSAIDTYVNNGGKILSTAFTSTKDALGKPLNSIRLKSFGVNPSFETFKRAKSTYLKVSDNDKASLGQKEFKDFSIMMTYSDFLQCTTSGAAKGYMKFLPATRFGPPEKSYYTQENITNFPGVVSNTYGKGRSVFIPWELGSQYLFKGHYMHRAMFVSALQNLLNVERTVVTDASPLIEITHLANRNGAFEWLGLINHSGQVGGSLREPVTIHNTNIRFKPTKPIKELKLMRSGTTLNFKQVDGWVECNVPQLHDFDMLLCLYN
ncbi:MAG: Beta-galactosidase [Segetibacter sp.]|nr:Beta-galactosidase [Segetibacter sp.]